MLDLVRRVTIQDSGDLANRQTSVLNSTVSKHVRRISIPAKTRIVLTGDNAAPPDFDPEQDFLDALGG